MQWGVKWIFISKSLIISKFHRETSLAPRKIAPDHGCVQHGGIPPCEEKLVSHHRIRHHAGLTIPSVVLQQLGLSQVWDWIPQNGQLTVLCALTAPLVTLWEGLWEEGRARGFSLYLCAFDPSDSCLPADRTQPVTVGRCLLGTADVGSGGVWHLLAGTSLLCLQGLTDALSLLLARWDPSHRQHDGEAGQDCGEAKGGVPRREAEESRPSGPVCQCDGWGRISFSWLSWDLVL